jgi:hypothetical protein
MISRDWQCLNRGCAEVFHSFEKSNPPCPKCGCVRVDWIPGGGHIMAKAPGYDRLLREQADRFGFTNLNSPSPSRLNRAAPRVEQPKPDYGGQPMHFAPGFSSPISTMGATCQPSSSAVDLRGRIPIGGIAAGGAVNTASPFQRSNTIPGAAANTTIEARTSQRNQR